MACLVFCAFISRVQSPGDREQDIKEQTWNGEKNNKSILGGSETIDRGLPAEPLSHTHGLYWAFPCPSPSSAGFTFPFSWAVTKRELVSQQVWPAFSMLPVGGSGWGGAVEELSVPG